MPATLTTTQTETPKFTIIQNIMDGRFHVLRDGVALRDRNEYVRKFATRNSARKRIARERSGNLHR